jgi:ribosomal protein S27AE
MPKVTEAGIFLSKDFCKEIPSGLKVRCGFCFAKLETIEGDSKKAKFTKKAEKTQGGKISVFGWTLKCPECGKNVFFASPNMNHQDYKKANGWKY